MTAISAARASDSVLSFAAAASRCLRHALGTWGPATMAPAITSIAYCVPRSVAEELVGGLFLAIVGPVPFVGQAKLAFTLPQLGAIMAYARLAPDTYTGTSP